MKAEPIAKFRHGLVAIACLLAGCATTSVAPTQTGRHESIERNATVFLVTPADGNYGDKVYIGSGTAVADAFAHALRGKGLRPVRGPLMTDLDEAFSQARVHECTYVLIPRISHWEDRATEWSGKADKLSIIVRVYHVADRQEISNAELSGKSSWFSLGGDHPQDLLQEPIDNYVSSLTP